jgi:RHS repeat-associated protein
MLSRASNLRRFAIVSVACCALGTPLAHATGRLTVAGTLSPQGTSNFCVYSAMSDDSQGNWQVTCGGTGSKTITFTTPLTSQVCTSFSSLNEDSGGNWSVANCVSSAPAQTAATVYYVHTDNLGTPRVVTRPTDDVTMWKWDDTEPFGFDAANETVSGAAFSYNLRFPGQYSDSETGTQYNYARDYDPSLGRYIESDPIGLHGGLNTFGYVRGNPLSRTDRLGLVDWSGTLGGVAGVDGAGAGFFRFDLTSECKCGRKVHIKGYASTVAVGLGAKYTGSGSSASFHDYDSCPNAGVANGGAAIASAAAVTGGGVSCSKTTLGHLYSSGDACGGPGYGFDVSVGIYLGSSIVTEATTVTCDCKQGGQQ